MHLLAFCCAIAAELPYKKADEPLTLLTTINSIVVRSTACALVKNICKPLSYEQPCLIALGTRKQTCANDNTHAHTHTHMFIRRCGGATLP